MKDKERLTTLVKEMKAVLPSALEDLKPVDLTEAVLARTAMERMLAFKSLPHWTPGEALVAFIHESRNALVPAKIYLNRIVQIPEARKAQLAVQRILDFVDVCAGD